MGKPFNIKVLLARIRANLRRYNGVKNGAMHTDVPQSASMEQIRFSKWTFDRSRFQIFDPAGHSGGLTIREYNLLNVLIQSAGKPVRREVLCEAIRESNYIPTPRAIDVKITRIRRKIGDNAENPHIIKTLRGVGYMFDADAII